MISVAHIVRTSICSPSRTQWSLDGLKLKRIPNGFGRPQGESGCLKRSMKVLGRAGKTLEDLEKTTEGKTDEWTDRWKLFSVFYRTLSTWGPLSCIRSPKSTSGRKVRVSLTITGPGLTFGNLTEGSGPQKGRCLVGLWKRAFLRPSGAFPLGCSQPLKGSSEALLGTLRLIEAF